jgi:hypothetical protein
LGDHAGHKKEATVWGRLVSTSKQGFASAIQGFWCL